MTGHGPRRARAGACTAFLALAAAACEIAPQDRASVAHPVRARDLLPTASLGPEQRASGAPLDEWIEQPLPFPHHRHSTVLAIDCRFCHADARRAPSAGIPPVETCMGCHLYVLPKSAQIAILRDHWDRGVPIPWKRVHDLPDHVYFTHEAHERGGVACEECHGDVATMGAWTQDAGPDGLPVMVRTESLQMDWCLACHETDVRIDANWGDRAEIRRADLSDCLTCHR